MASSDDQRTPTQRDEAAASRTHEADGNDVIRTDDLEVPEGDAGNVSGGAPVKGEETSLKK